MSNIISVEVARKLLKKLANDDDFRARFLDDAESELEGLGHKTPAADRGVPGRDPVLTLKRLRGGLASKEKIAAATDTMLATYETYARTGDASVLAFHQFDFCAE